MYTNIKREAIPVKSEFPIFIVSFFTYLYSFYFVLIRLLLQGEFSGNVDSVCNSYEYLEDDTLDNEFIKNAEEIDGKLNNYSVCDSDEENMIEVNNNLSSQDFDSNTGIFPLIVRSLKNFS